MVCLCAIILSPYKRTSFFIGVGSNVKKANVPWFAMSISDTS